MAQALITEAQTLRTEANDSLDTLDHLILRELIRMQAAPAEIAQARAISKRDDDGLRTTPLPRKTRRLMDLLAAARNIAAIEELMSLNQGSNRDAA